MQEDTSRTSITEGVIGELERGVQLALETYSNVHRGSGHNSMVTTHLFEQARDIVLEYLGLKKGRYVVIFCTPRRAEILIKNLVPGDYKIVSSQEIGLSIGVRALVIKRKDLPRGTPFQTGGGTTRLISKKWVIWANPPAKLEAGTPAIINVITLARTLQLTGKFGDDIFLDPEVRKVTAAEILYEDELKEYSGQELLDELRQTQIGHRVSVPTIEGAKNYVNLDNSASTPTFSPIWNVFRQTWRQTPQVRQEMIHKVKLICAEMVGAPLTSYDLIFTSNTTEAINLTAESLSHEIEDGIEPVILNTILEHSSNDLPWRMVPRHSLIRLSVDPEGFVDLNELEALLRTYNQKGEHGKQRIKLVAVSGASNVLGVCNNIAEISQIVHKYGVQLLVDAAQLIAHRKVDMEASGIDYLAFSAHKVYAPFGCGVLVVRKGLLRFSAAELKTIQSSGEENVAGIAALGKAFILLHRIGMDLVRKEEQALTRLTLRGLSQIPGLTIFGITTPDSPGFAQKLGVIVFELKGMMANRVANELAVQGGIGVRSGCHCAHIIIKHVLHVSPGLERFQRLMLTMLPKLSLPGLVRVSLGIENNEEDVDRLIQSLKKINRQPQVSSASKKYDSNNLTKADVQKQMNDFVSESSLRVYL